MMTKSTTQIRTKHAGEQLWLTVKVTSFSGLFLSLFGSGIIWAGTQSFHCTAGVWKISAILNLAFFLLAWLAYLPFRNTDQLLGRGLLATSFFISVFWIFGFAGFYFYFMFSPIPVWLRITASAALTSALLYRAHVITLDIRNSFRKHTHLFEKIYHEESDIFTCSSDAFLLLQKNRPDRNPFKPIHAYVAAIVAPFMLILNRILMPVVGDGHGVFLVVAFFSVPILLFGVDIFVQTVITMIYYPIKLQRETGKPVLMKDW